MMHEKEAQFLTLRVLKKNVGIFTFRVYGRINGKWHFTIFSKPPYLFTQENFLKVVLPLDLPQISHHVAATPLPLFFPLKPSKTSLPVSVLVFSFPNVPFPS